MKLIKLSLVILAVAATLVQAEGEGDQPAPEQPQPPPEQPQPQPEQPQPQPEQPQPQPEQPQPQLATELVTPTPAPPAPVTEAWESVVSSEYTDFRMSIDHTLGNVLVQIVDWQASMFGHIQSSLSPLLAKWNDLKSEIRNEKANEEVAIRTADSNHSKLLLQQQVSLLKEALSTGNRIENILVREQQTIEKWTTDAQANVENARSRKTEISDALETTISKARNDIKETKSSIQKIFQDHYYSIENDLLETNGKLDKGVLSFKAVIAQLTTAIHMANNTVSNRLAQEANSLQEVIDSTVSGLRRQLDSDLMAADRDKIVNHLDERSQQLDENLFIGHSENLISLDNYVRNLIADINNNIWSLENDVNTMKNQFQQLTSVNKARANRLSIQTYKTLEPVESLLSSLSKKLQRSVDSVQM